MALRDNVASVSGWRWRAEADGDRSARARAIILGLVLLYLLLFLTSLGSGASDTSLWTAFSRWLGGGTDSLPLRDRVVIWDIRLPRVVLGSLIGASLAVSGAVMQGLFRNPLADPGIVGVGPGAGLGAITVIVLGNTVLEPVIGIFGIYALPLAAFFGGIVSTLLLYRVATRRGQTSIATMLLAGIALGALAGALSGILVYAADDQELRDLTFWGLGSLAGASWAKIWAAGPIILAALAAAPFLARGLDAMVLGEASANHLGIRVQRVKNCAILTVAAATGASVAVAGGIGFVGIVVPHLLRLTIGPEHRYLLPASALLGACLLLVSDATSRMVVAPAELPIGIVTATLGAPFFLWILLRQRGLLDL